MCVFAALAAGHHRDFTAGFQCRHRVRPGSPRPQAHHHDADLRQAAALRAGFRLAQGADLRLFLGNGTPALCLRAGQN